MVFDSKDFFAAKGKAGDIEIRFSRGQSADDTIVDLVAEASHPKQIVVVTNDRGLKQRIQGTGAKTMGVGEFLH